MNWKAKLREVHSHVWTVWKSQLSAKPLKRLRLQDSAASFFPDETMDNLDNIVIDMPVKAKYSRTI